MSTLRIDGVFDPEGIEQGAKQAEAAFRELGEDVKANADRANAAVSDLADTDVSRLSGGLAKAALAVEDLKEKIEAARAAGSPVSPEVTAQLQRLEGAVDAASARMSRLAQTKEDLRKRGALLGQDLGALQGSFSSLDSVLQTVADRGAGAGKSFAELGVKVGLAAGAFKLGWETGKQLDAWLKQHKVNLAEIISGTNKYTQALDRMGVTALSVVGKKNRLKAAIAGVTDELRKADPALDRYKKAQEEAARVGDAWAASLKRLAGIQGADVQRFIRENSEALVDLGKQLREHPELWNKLTSAVGETGVTIKSQLGEAIAEAERFQAALEAAQEEIAKLPAVVTAGEEAIRAFKEEFGDTSALDEFAQKLEELKQRIAFEKESLEKGIGVEGSAGRSKALAEEQAALRDGLKREAEAQRELREALRAIGEEYANAEAKAKELRHAENDAANAAHEHSGSIESLREQFFGLDVELGQLAAAFSGMARVVEPATDSIYDVTEAGRRMSESLVDIARDSGLAQGYLFELTNQFRSGAVDTAEFHRRLDALQAGLSFTGKAILFPHLEQDIQRLKSAAAAIRDVWTGEEILRVFDPFAEAAKGAFSSVEEAMRGMVPVADEVMGEIEERAAQMQTNIMESFDAGMSAARRGGSMMTVTVTAVNNLEGAIATRNRGMTGARQL